MQRNESSNQDSGNEGTLHRAASRKPKLDDEAVRDMQQWGGLKEHMQRTALARAVVTEEGLPQQEMQSARPSKEVRHNGWVR